jgi:hypothetical protein
MGSAKRKERRKDGVIEESTGNGGVVGQLEAYREKSVREQSAM